MEKETLHKLVGKLLAGNLNDAERADLQSYVLEASNREQFVTVLDELTDSETGTLPFDEKYWQPIIREITKPTEIHPISKKRGVISLWKVAAALIVIIVTAAFIFSNMNKEAAEGLRLAQDKAPEQIAPGTNGAILTLADGTVVPLDSAGNEVITKQGGAKIRQQNGQLIYVATGEVNGAVQYNKMATPKGRQYQLLLPDGSHVWLNAASSIRYPTVFNGKERMVEISGEAYVKVAPNADQPFRVKLKNGAAVDVLGTAFNIKAYDDQPGIAATLVEGAIAFNVNNERKILKPGQQALWNDNLSVVNADLDRVLAWKNGFFNFDGMDMQEAMQQIERWYDIDVKYESGIPGIRFGGKMPRNLNLDELLRILKRAELKYRMEGRTLIVMK